jgi:hypothetical protein
VIPQQRGQNRGKNRFAAQKGVAALLAVKVALAIAASSRRLAAVVLGAKALHAGPGLDQRAVDREMVVRQQRFDRPLAEHRGDELPGDVTFDQTVAVFGEHRLVPYPASNDSPTNQRNSRLWSSCSTNCFSERTE